VADFYLAVALILLISGTAGLIRIGLGPTAADRVLAVNLLGTNTAAMVLLVGAAAGVEGAVDVALIAAVLASFVSITFMRRLWWRPGDEERGRP
jgi:multicomponent Na+:H+ antiporter subunit F